MLSLKPLLDDGFGKTDRSVLLWDAAGGYWADDITRQSPAKYLRYSYFMGVRQGGNDHAPSPVCNYAMGNARRLLLINSLPRPLLNKVLLTIQNRLLSSSGALITVARRGIDGLFIMINLLQLAAVDHPAVLAPIVSIAIRVVSKRFRSISKKYAEHDGTSDHHSAEQMLKGHKEVLDFWRSGSRN